MLHLFDRLSDRLTGRVSRSADSAAPIAPRRFRCRCGQPVFFRNTECLACHAPLGYDSETLSLHPLQPVGEGFALDGEPAQPRLRRCANFARAGCNWLLPDADFQPHEGLCRACRLNRTIPDLGQGDNLPLWGRIEIAKRRLVSQLLALDLPVRGRMTEDPARGLMFDFLRAAPGTPPVMTGHMNGLVTLNVEEADDATRERVRAAMHEPYRTLLGHLRHEVGHYYWDRLVAGTGWEAAFRNRFGDERASYADALQRHYELGAAPDWPQRCVSAYASAHPWEDWAETWAHYLHMVDTVDTALSFGLEGGDVEIELQDYGVEALDARDDPGATRFLGFVNGWVALTAALNELSRSMGQHDFYPFVLSVEAVRKLHFVHRVVTATAAGR